MAANNCYHVAAFYRAKAHAAPAGYLARFYRAAAVGYLLLACKGQGGGDGFPIPAMYQG